MSEAPGFATVALLLEQVLVELRGLRTDILARWESTPTFPAPESEGLWTAAEVASYLRCSRSKVYQRAEDGTLPSLHVGGQLRFEPPAVRAWARGEGHGAGRVLSMRKHGVDRG
jgi:excisionase family DNA binding protein